MKWYHYTVTWPRGKPPLPRHLSSINRLLRSADYDALLLTEHGFVDPETRQPSRWRYPRIDANEVRDVIHAVSGVEAEVTRTGCNAPFETCEVCYPEGDEQ